MTRFLTRFLTRFFALPVAILIAGLANLETTFAHTHHTADFCSATAKDICAHLGYNEPPNSADESKFMLDLQPSKVNASLISKVAVSLHMDMGGSSHGSSPVTIKQVDAAHYQVTKAYFTMTGKWVVKVNFEYNGAGHEIQIPIEVQ